MYIYIYFKAYINMNKLCYNSSLNQIDLIKFKPY